MPNPTYDWSELIAGAFDMLADAPEGLTIAEITDRLDVDLHVARQTVNRLREELADDSDVNVLIISRGKERVYRLVGADANAADDGMWLAFNQKYVTTRLRTVRNVYQSLRRSTEDEKYADDCRLILKTLDRVLEDIDEMNERRAREAAKPHADQV